MGIDLEALRADVARWAERFAPYREDDNDWYRAAENIDGKDASGLGDLFAELARHLGAGKPVAADRAALVERVKAAIEMFLGDWLDASYGPYDQLAQLSVSAVEAAGWGPLPMPIRAILDAPELTAEEERAMQDLSGPRAEPVAGTGEALYRKCPDCPGDGTSCWTCDDEGYVPVAPPDDRTVNCHVCGEYIGVRFGEVYTPGDDICATCIAELAALPARHAVPVEGA